MMRIAALAMLLVATPAWAQDWAKERADKSPRHQEWVDVKVAGRTVHAFIVYPEVKNKATAVLVIHEIFGASDWAREMTDEIAGAGYIAILPDLLSEVGGTKALGDRNSVTQAIGRLPPEQITQDLNAVADYVTKLPAANGKLAVMGFCWGGGQAFRFATDRKGLAAALVFYGMGADPAAMAKITAPVYGFYAGNDARVGATVPDTTKAMKAAGKTYEPVTYDGAGHGFMRAGEDPTNTVEANTKARAEAWTRVQAILAKIK